MIKKKQQRKNEKGRKEANRIFVIFGKGHSNFIPFRYQNFLGLVFSQESFFITFQSLRTLSKNSININYGLKSRNNPNHISWKTKITRQKCLKRSQISKNEISNKRQNISNYQKNILKEIVCIFSFKKFLKCLCSWIQILKHYL